MSLEYSFFSFFPIFHVDFFNKYIFLFIIEHKNIIGIDTQSNND